MRYTFIKEHRNFWAVSLMAGVLAVSVSGFYAWSRRGKSQRVRSESGRTKR